jgi:hypothetical protein
VCSAVRYVVLYGSWLRLYINIHMQQGIMLFKYGDVDRNYCYGIWTGECFFSTVKTFFGFEEERPIC